MNRIDCRRVLFLLIFSSFLNLTVYAQVGYNTIVVSDSIENVEDKNHAYFEEKTNRNAYIASAALITYGITTRLVPQLQDFDHSIDSKISEMVDRKYSFDDYLLFAPYVGLLAIDLLPNISAKHTHLDRLFLAGSAGTISISTFLTGKYLFGIERPDKSNSFSFPSGHSALAFTGAHLLHKEYKDSNPWISVAGYATAITTGTMRMINHKHWFSDVLTGAGIGILSVELSYLLLPYWQNISGKYVGNSKLSFSPTLINNRAGFYFSYSF